VLLLPTVSFWRNWADQEERGHDFGYRFGYYMFKPGGEYPDMERNAILFGGTDPGRFVPTYMIFVESSVPPSTRTRSPKCPDSATLDRRDVYILTQNALADPTYLDYIRDQYDFSRPRLDDPNSLTNRSSFFRWLNRLAWNTLGRSMAYPKAPIWTPSHRDSLRALQQYIQDLRSRPPLPGEEVRIEGGKVSVQGVAGVMAINGILTKEIFDHNKDTHAFYVEESYVIPWMYPYLEPYGIILKLNREPLAELTPAMVERDTKYWDALFHDLDADPRFHRDDVAQKTFSKLRSAIGGLYASRRMFPEAEYAFQQAITLCPDSPEANFRLAKLYVDLGRFDDANKVLQLYQKRDPSDLRIRVAASQIQEIRRTVEMIHDLERQLQSQPNNVSLAMRLARLYTARQQVDRLDRLVNQLVASPDLTQNDFLQLANLYVPLNRSDRVVTMLMLFVQRYPQSPVGWYNLAVVQSLENNCAEALPALERALTLDNPDQQVRRFARDDPKLDNCRQDPRFLRLLQSIDNTGSTNLLPFTITR
jgi:tetratricopeptide (TPR) repeat protein